MEVMQKYDLIFNFLLIHALFQGSSPSIVQRRSFPRLKTSNACSASSFVSETNLENIIRLTNISFDFHGNF